MGSPFLLEHLDPTLAVWRQAAYVTGGLVVFLLGWILAVRMSRSIDLRRRRAVTKRWRPIFEGREPLSDHALTFCLSLSCRDRVHMLHLWNDCYDEGRSIEAAARLIDIAQRLPLPQCAKTFLSSRRLHRKLLAVRTLGRLKERSVWNDLETLVAHQNPFVALHAVQALLSIDAAAAMPFLISTIGRRTDWSPLAVATILCTAGQDLASEALAKAATTGDLAVGSRLLRHLPVTQSPRGLPIVRQFLQTQPQISDDFLAACLFIFGEFQEPADLPIIRRHLFHPVWYVRVQAAAALGKLGTQSDEARLTALLSDPEWWVRYRAAEALVNLRSMTEEKLETLQETLPLPEAQEMLATALAKFRQRRLSRPLVEMAGSS
ncbi:MAG: HEAT repeat domain-containing protein [Nitrospira sp.]|nr:HEAT repeat domain-containing protein [Nitrospira sp.]